MKNALIIAVSMSFLFAAPAAEAAVFSIYRADERVVVGDEVSFEVRVNTEQEEINSFGGRLVFPSFLTPLAARDGNSVISLWIERPTIDGSAVRFAGMVPGGYAGQNGLLLTVIARVNRDAEGEIEFISTEAYIDDGSGTKAQSVGVAHEVSVSTGIARKKEYEDTVPPEPLTPVRGQDPSIFEGRFFVAFSAVDKQSGVARYEVAEKRGLKTKNYSSLTWVEAESPHLLSDQSLKSHVYVKAVDEEGNERIATLLPGGRYGVYAGWSILIVLLASWALGYFIKKKKYRWLKIS